MSLSTSYRYEAMTEKKSLQNALHRQQERIKRDEMVATLERQAKIEHFINLKSDWNESLEAAAAKRKTSLDSKLKKAELRLSKKASIMVRQAALKYLLETEYSRYEKELHDMGKAFYIKRT